MKNRKIKAIALLLAAVLVFSTFIYNVQAVKTIQWPIGRYEYGKLELEGYESLPVAGTVTVGKSVVAYSGSECYEVRVPETGYYRLDSDGSFAIRMAVSMNGDKVEKFVNLEMDINHDGYGNYNCLLWLEGECSYYLRFQNVVENHYKYSFNLVFLDEIVSAEIETDPLYVGSDIFYEEFNDRFYGTPYLLTTRYNITFSCGYTEREWTRTVIIDSLTTGKHTLTLNVFNGHGPELEVNIIDTGEQIERIEIPDKEKYLYVKVAEDGRITFNYWPACLRIYFKDGSVVDAPGEYYPGASNMSPNFYSFTQPDGTELTITARYEADQFWMNKCLYQAVDDAINKTFDPDYENPYGFDSVWLCLYLENKDYPTVKEKADYNKYVPRGRTFSRHDFTGTVMSFIALPVFALMKAVCSHLPFTIYNSISTAVVHYYFRFML
jgi:hypothetical protein